MNHSGHMREDRSLPESNSFFQVNNLDRAQWPLMCPHKPQPGRPCPSKCVGRGAAGALKGKGTRASFFPTHLFNHTAPSPSSRAYSNPSLYALPFFHTYLLVWQAVILQTACLFYILSTILSNKQWRGVIYIPSMEEKHV